MLLLLSRGAGILTGTIMLSVGSRLLWFIDLLIREIVLPRRVSWNRFISLSLMSSASVTLDLVDLVV